MEPSNFVAVSAEGDVAFYDVSINATRVWVGNCPSVCQRKSFIAPGELLRLGNGFAVMLDTNCSGAAGVGMCVSKHIRGGGVTLLAELPAETVPSSVGVNGDTVAFAIKNASTFEGFTIFVRSAAGGLQKVLYEGSGGPVRQLVLIGTDKLAALVGEEVSIYARTDGGSFARVQVIGDNTALISKIRASDTKLAVAFLRDENATLELFKTSAADGKWTLETTFTNGWLRWDMHGKASPPMVFDLDGDRVVYTTEESFNNGLLMTYPCPPIPPSPVAIAGYIAAGVVGTTLIVVLIAIKFRAARKTANTVKAEEHRVEPLI
jgi:hypothetical protein